MEFLWILMVIPLLYLYLSQFTKNPMPYYRGVFYIVFAEYTILLLCVTVLFRDTLENVTIQTELLWGYKNPPDIIVNDNLANIGAFIPFGFLACVIAKRLAFVKAVLLGLLVSETIECSQLIFKRGAFDVDDIINNTIGTIIGTTLWIIVRRAVPVLYYTVKNEK